MKMSSSDQPNPKPEGVGGVGTSVLKDVEERIQKGKDKYKSLLTPFNGRLALQDAYQEALDLVMYIRQHLLEMEHPEFRAYLLAFSVHRNQLYGDDPYMWHVARVASQFFDEELRIVGWLHDVLEDSNLTAEDLRSYEFSEAVVDAVEAITHRKTETYEEYIQRVAKNRLALAVKMADLEDNMESCLFDPKKRSLYERYKKAYSTLMEVEPW